MASKKLGSKSELFRREGETWFCKPGLPSDVTIEVGDASFHLHKFPLLSRSGLLEKLIEDSSNSDEPDCVLQLDSVPGGSVAFELIAKFCYGVIIELNALNVVSLRCAAEYLQMTEDYGERNLIVQTVVFVDEVFGNWADTIIALKTCEEVLPYAKDLHIVSRCIDSLAVKACTDMSLFSLPLLEINNVPSTKETGTDSRMGTSAADKPQNGNDWWHEDVSILNLTLYKQLILAIQSKGMNPESIATSLIYYAKRHIPIMSGQSRLQEINHDTPAATISAINEDDQRVLLEEIVALLPNKNGVTTTKFLLQLLLTAMILRASPLCRENLEKRVGEQLEQAALVDILVPYINYLGDSLYDIDCIQRIVDHFVSVNRDAMAATSIKGEQGQLMSGNGSPRPMAKVASLVDGFLKEVAPDVNLKLPKFHALAALIPDFSRPVSDSIYHAVDVYLKAHPWLTESEREQLCRLMDFQKLSLEASTHAAQNERLPLRVLVQVLFFEQLRLRTSITGWSYSPDQLVNSQNLGENTEHRSLDESLQMEPDQESGVNDVRECVSELQKECLSMKQELQKLVKTKKGWNIFTKQSCINKKSEIFDPKDSKLLWL